MNIKNLSNKNFISRGVVYLVRCPKCEKENYAPNVASGVCTWCGLNGNEYYKEEIKKM